MAIGSKGQIVIFTNFCYGFKADISVEFDVSFGFWQNLDRIPGDTVSYALGTVYIYITTVSSLCLFSALLNWFMGCFGIVSISAQTSQEGSE